MGYVNKPAGCCTPTFGAPHNNNNNKIYITSNATVIITNKMVSLQDTT
jgi:hypothetical protein